MFTFETLDTMTVDATALLENGFRYDAFDTVITMLHAAQDVCGRDEDNEQASRGLDLDSHCTWMQDQWHKQHDKGIRTMIRDISEFAYDVLQDQRSRERRAAMQPSLI